MENQELLHPENADVQNQEVNSGASVEAQDITSQETPASVEENAPIAEEPVVEPAAEPAAE
ncbi:MAG: hypothetical protein J6S48_01525, partial [Bacteroidales bacterium]|nr:hypothetical protein [Bacteroidales bacterium]